jgi:multidrug resistance protein
MCIEQLIVAKGSQNYGHGFADQSDTCLKIVTSIFNHPSRSLSSHFCQLVTSLEARHIQPDNHPPGRRSLVIIIKMDDPDIGQCGDCDQNRTNDMEAVRASPEPNVPAGMDELSGQRSNGSDTIITIRSPLLRVKSPKRSRSPPPTSFSESRLNKIRQSRNAIIAVVALALFTDMVLYDVIVPILPTLLRAAGRDESSVGILFAVYAVGFLVATPTCGIWSDRTGNRMLPMIIGQAALAFATILFGFSHTFWLLILARALQGAAAAVSWTLGLALLADAVPSEELGAAMGVVFGFHTLGYFVGPLLGGILTQTVSIRMPFVVCAGLCVLDLLGRALLKPPPPISSFASSSSSTMQSLNDGTPQKLSMWSLLAHPEVFFIALSVVLTSNSFSAVETLLASHLHRLFGLDVMGVSFAMMAIIFPSVLFSFLAGYWADRHNRYGLILASMCFYIIATPLMGLARPLWAFLIASAYFGATSSVLQAPALPEMGAIVSRLGGASYAQVYAILNICYSIGMLVGPLVASWVNERWGFFTAMCVCSVPFLLLIMPFIWLTLRNRNEQPFKP